jgi:iron complex transport system substrate-binding protein
MHSAVLGFSLCLCVSVVNGFLAGTAHADVSVKDDIGNTVKLAQPAKRIVSLAPHMTETLFAAGAGAQIVGTVDYSDYPEAAKKIQRVGGYSRFDLEAIAALKPDLIVAWQSGNAAGAHRQTQGPSVSDLHLATQPHRGCRQRNRAPRHAGRNERHRRCRSQTLSRRLAALRAQIRYSRADGAHLLPDLEAAADDRRRNQIISDAIRLCGGDNVFGKLEQMAPTVSVEAVIAANPEAIIASGMGDSRPEWLDDWKKWTSIEAVKRDNLFFVPPELIQRHTPRLLEGTEILCKHLETVRGRRGK